MARPEPIPQANYQSWSLFLVCDLRWLLKENQEKLQDLYNQFLAFGQVIGPNHLAVWFWQRPPVRDAFNVAEETDVDRSSEYCRRFNLLPSKGPHILVTTIHPEEAEAIDGPKAILELNNASSTDIQILLLKLTDQLLVQGLQQKDLDSEAYWLAWRRSLESTYTLLNSFLQYVKFTIDVKFFKVEIGGKSS